MELSENTPAAPLTSGQGTSALIGWGLLFSTAAGGAAVAAAPLALGVLGFKSAGVAAGSIAATIQSTVYGGYVGAGSWFAAAQSIGAVGITAGGVIKGAIIGAAVKLSR